MYNRPKVIVHIATNDVLAVDILYVRVYNEGKRICAHALIFATEEYYEGVQSKKNI